MYRPSIFLALILSSTAAYARGENAGFAISANVPEVCQLETTTLTASSSTGEARGTVFEMCNSGRGFRVIASYRTLRTGEDVQLDYDGQISRLDISGYSSVVQRRGPIARRTPVAINSVGLTEPIAISFGIAAI